MLITGEKGQRIEAGVWKVLLHLANAIRPAHGLDGWTGSSHGQREIVCQPLEVDACCSPLSLLVLFCLCT